MDATAWFLVLVAAIVVAFLAYGMARRARGSIEVSLTQTDFEAGETVHGQIAIHAKKPIEAERLVVTVTATEITETAKDGKTTRSSEQVFRDEVMVEGARSYAANTRETREFDISLPEPKAEAVPEPKSVGGKASFASLKLTKPPKTQLKWRLGVRLVAKGIDLGTSRPIAVNIEHL